MKDKSKLRKEILEQRLRLPLHDVEQKSEIIMSILFSTDAYKQAKVVMFYVDMRNEVMTKKAIMDTVAQGKRLVVPRVKKGYGLLAIEIKSLDELEPGTFGYLSHRKERNTLDEIDLVGTVWSLIKMDTASDTGGLLRQFLPSFKTDAKKIAVAFEMQMIEQIPYEGHDVRMDKIITEKGMYGPF